MLAVNDVKLLYDNDYKDHWPFITKFISYNEVIDRVLFALIYKQPFVFNNYSHLMGMKDSVQQIFESYPAKYFSDRSRYIWGEMYDGQECCVIYTDKDTAIRGFNLIKSIYAPWSNEYKVINKALLDMDSYNSVNHVNNQVPVLVSE